MKQRISPVFVRPPFILVSGLLVVTIPSSGPAQTPSPPANQSPVPGLRKLTGDDAKRAEELGKAIEAAQKRGRWDEAIARAEQLLALRTRVQGPKLFETVNEEWRAKTLRLLPSLREEDRVALQSARTMAAEAEAAFDRIKHAQAQSQFEKTLSITRRLLTDNHPETAKSYYRLGLSLWAQGKFVSAELPLTESLAIRRRLLTDAHPDTFESYNRLAMNFKYQSKFEQAQQLYEKALAISRELFGDEGSNTAEIYLNMGANLLDQDQVAQAQPLVEKALVIMRRLQSDEDPSIGYFLNTVGASLNAQGKYAEAEAFYERALSIRRRFLTDDHPLTSISYASLAANHYCQGRYAEAQPLFENALSIAQRLLSDDDHWTAKCYGDLAYNLFKQRKYRDAQALAEKSLEIRRHLFRDNHRNTADSCSDLAEILEAQGKYTHAQLLFESALEIHRRLLGEENRATATRYHELARNLQAQGRYAKARDKWLKGEKGQGLARLRSAFTGMERVRAHAGADESAARLGLAAVLARLGQPAEAWRRLEADLGRGLLDELAARTDTQFTPAERARLRQLTAELDRLAEANPTDLDHAERAKRYEDLKRQRELSKIALGEFQTKLLRDYGVRARDVAGLTEVQAALAADTALVAWVDIPPVGPNAADPDGDHWGVVVRSRGVPAWVAVPGSGADGLWTKDDTELAGHVRTELRRRPDAATMDVRGRIEKLRAERLEPLTKYLGMTANGLPPVRRLIVLPSRAIDGIPVEAVLAADDARTVSYAPSATVYKYLREQPRPDSHAGLLALGDPIYERPDKSSDPAPVPHHGLLVNVVTPDSNAATHGLKRGDVLLAYNGKALGTKDDLKIVTEGRKPIDVQIWRDGQSSQREIGPGELGATLHPRPAREAIAADRALDKALMAARSGSDKFAQLPGTRYEVRTVADMFAAVDRPARVLLGADASEPELDRLASARELGRFGFIHLATHSHIDEAIPQRSAVILTQIGLPDPLDQVLNHKPVFDGRLSVREIQHSWDLKAELVTLSACETALGREAGGEGFVGFTQALLMSGTRSVCLSLWKVDDRSTALLMQRFYANLLGARPGLSEPIPKAESLAEAKRWLRSLTVVEVGNELAALERGHERPLAKLSGTAPASAKTGGVRPYDHPYFWAAFVLVGDPD
jgi:tetratricopeptide (TPR) repeat protein